MAEETKVTPESEVKDSSETKQGEGAAPEGSIGAELDKITPEDKQDADHSKETVPLSVFLSLKEDMKELKSQLKEAKASEKKSVQIEGVKDLAAKYPDVSEDLLNDLLVASTSKAKAEVLQEVAPILERQKHKEEKEQFDRAFDKVFENAIKDNPDLPENIDKELIKTLVLTPKYRNVKVADILSQIYPKKEEGRQSSENDSVYAAGEIETIKSFENITEDQRKAVMADEKARKAYFDWLDKQVGQ